MVSSSNQRKKEQLLLTLLLFCAGTMSNEKESKSSEISKQPEDVPQCLICHETLGDCKQVTSRCKHDFHKECFDGWRSFLESQGRSLTTCPYCRQALPIDSSLPKSMRLWYHDFAESENGWSAYGMITTPGTPKVNADARPLYDRFHISHPSGSYGNGRLLSVNGADEYTITDIQSILDMVSEFPPCNIMLGAPWHHQYEITFVHEESLTVAGRRNFTRRIRQRLTTLPPFKFRWYHLTNTVTLM